MREDLVQTAIDFLSIPKVANNSKPKKTLFLKSKGLTDREIEIAFKRIDNSSYSNKLTDSSSVEFFDQGNSYGQDSSSWSLIRRFTYSSAVIGTFCYGLHWLYQKFVEPSFIKYLQDKFTSIDNRLEQLNHAVQKSEDQNQVLHDFVKSMKEKSQLATANSYEIDEIKEEMATIKALIAKNSTKGYLDVVIVELKKEIATVKDILLKESPPAKIPSWQLNEKETSKKIEKEATPVENGKASKGKAHKN